MDDLIPPMPGVLSVSRKADSGLPTDALVIAGQKELDNTEGVSANVRNLTLYGREDISKGRFATSFSLHVYLVARRFMPNNSTRWHSETAKGFDDGDIDAVYLPPSGEVNCYRTFVGGDAPTAEPDGLGAILNATELTADAERRAELWKLAHSMSAEGHGQADTFELAKKPRLVDGPVVEASVVVDGVETYTEIAVGNIADTKAREMIAQKRIAQRKVNVQGNPVV